MRSEMSNICSDYILFFFFNDTATTEIYTLSLHDALPIFRRLLDDLEQRVEALGGHHVRLVDDVDLVAVPHRAERRLLPDRKSTRLNSSHANISYAVFCLKKKKDYHKTFRSMTNNIAHCYI